MQRDTLKAAAQRSGPSEDIDAALIPIRDRFREQLLDRIITLEALRISVRKRQDPLIAIQSIMSIAHKISGVAATLGYVQAGDLAARLEQQYNYALDSHFTPAELWSSTEPQLVALLDELESLVDE